MKSKNFNYTLILFILIVISYIFNLININIYNNSYLSLGVIFYSLTYLIMFLMIRSYNIKDNKMILLSSVKYFMLFMLFVTILCQFNSNNELIGSIRDVFTPNSYNISDFTLYYPDVYKIIVYLLVYYFSHYIFMVTFEVSEESTGYLVGFLVSILISFILDQMIYGAIYNFPSIVMNNLNIVEFLRTLTSNFIVTLLSSIILLIFVPIINKISSGA